MNNPNENRFIFRKRISNDASGSISVYNLNSIPSGLYDLYFDKNTGVGTDFLYKLSEYVNNKFKHRWGEFQDSSCIWDIHKYYGSGQVPCFYDAYAPISMSGYVGGVESMTTSLYPLEVVETDYDNQIWNIKIYPGKFYVSGIPFYFFENPQKTTLTFFNGSCDIPSGLKRGMYTIMSHSGFYTGIQDVNLNNHVYEDYIYPTGSSRDSVSNVYRRRPNLNTSNSEINLSIASGEYYIDFNNNKIISSGIYTATLIWDETYIPSGYVVPFNINPLNLQSNIAGGYFIYLSI